MPTVAILLTNNDTAAFAARYPNDGQKVADLLRPLRPQWTYEVVAVRNGVLPASATAYDGYVITGSPASVNDPGLPWVEPLLAFIRDVHAARRPLIGLCFGHQAIAKALGGAVRRHPGGWGLGTAPTEWHAQECWMVPARARLQLLAAHNEQVHVPPPGARVIGGSAFCPVGAMQLGGHVLTTQFHPEMTVPFMQDLLGFLDDKLDAATLARARESLEVPVESEVFAQWMVQFIEQAWEAAP